MPENHPFTRLPEVPAFDVTSTTVADGEPFAQPQYSGAFGVPGGRDVSPHLSWSGAPAATRSYAVTVCDPDAPTQSGFWHWSVVGIPADVTSIEEGAGVEGSTTLPDGAYQLRNDGGSASFCRRRPARRPWPSPLIHNGARARRRGHRGSGGRVARLPRLTIASHILARATIVPTGEIPAD